MKRLLGIIAVLAVIISCSGEDTVNLPQPRTPLFHAESLHVEVEHIYIPLLNVWVWGATATYKYELGGYRGKLHTHEFVFSGLGDPYIDRDNTIADCFEPIDVQLDKMIRMSTTDDLFLGLDSVTVFFTIQGLHQECSGGSADSIAAIFWSDTVRAHVEDPRRRTTRD